MEPKFAVKSTYNEEMFYHQLAASEHKPMAAEEKKRGSFLNLNLTLQDYLIFPLMLAVFFTVYGDMELVPRLIQALATALLAWGIYHFFVVGRYRDGGKDKAGKNGGAKNGGAQNKTVQNKASYDESLLNRARAVLENSCLSGERCTIEFFDDGFQVENSGIMSWYRYEGIGWIRETSKYIVIFWNKSLPIPVEKAGLYRGKAGQLQGFLEKAAGKTIEKVRL